MSTNNKTIGPGCPGESLLPIDPNYHLHTTRQSAPILFFFKIPFFVCTNRSVYFFYFFPPSHWHRSRFAAVKEDCHVIARTVGREGSPVPLLLFRFSFFELMDHSASWQFNWLCLLLVRFTKCLIRFYPLEKTCRKQINKKRRKLETLSTRCLLNLQTTCRLLLPFAYVWYNAQRV